VILAGGSSTCYISSVGAEEVGNVAEAGRTDFEGINRRRFIRDVAIVGWATPLILTMTASDALAACTTTGQCPPDGTTVCTGTLCCCCDRDPPSQAKNQCGTVVESGGNGTCTDTGLRCQTSS
jgi:hypothetical protein